MNKPTEKILYIIVALALVSGGYYYIKQSQNKLLDYDVDSYTSTSDTSYNLNIGTIYELSEVITVQNDYFKYENIRLNADDVSIYITGLKVTNVSDSRFNTNISLIFYDSNKNQIGSFQYRPIDDVISDIGFIDPGSYAYSMFSIYENSLNEGYKISDVIYYSVENLT